MYLLPQVLLLTYCPTICLHMYPISLLGFDFEANEKVNSEDESMDEGSGMVKVSLPTASANLRSKLTEALKSLHNEMNDDEGMKDDE